jgi:large subunit ribosomal protein L24
MGRGIPLNPKAFARNLVKKWKIYPGDMVQIISGKDKGKQGPVKSVIRNKNRLIISGLNMLSRFKKKTETTPATPYLKENSIHYSNVMLIDPQTGKPTRVTYKYLKTGNKVRVSKDSGVVIPKPKVKKEDDSKDETNQYLKDTAIATAYEVTLNPQELTDLKNRYLRRMELGYYHHLKQVWEHAQVVGRKEALAQTKFEYDVMNKAQDLLKEKKAYTLDEILQTTYKAKKISDSIPELMKS